MDSDAALIIYLISYSPASRRISYDLGFSVQVLEMACHIFQYGLSYMDPASLAYFFITSYKPNCVVLV